jgi:hypothetical protein
LFAFESYHYDQIGTSGSTAIATDNTNVSVDCAVSELTAACAAIAVCRCGQATAGNANTNKVVHVNLRVTWTASHQSLQKDPAKEGQSDNKPDRRCEGKPDCRWKVS